MIDLSVLEVCLLISVKNLLDNSLDGFNFEMVYDKYREFTQRVATFGRATGVFFVKPVAHKVSLIGCR